MFCIGISKVYVNTVVTFVSFLVLISTHEVFSWPFHLFVGHTTRDSRQQWSTLRGRISVSIHHLPASASDWHRQTMLPFPWACSALPQCIHLCAPLDSAGSAHSTGDMWSASFPTQDGRQWSAAEHGGQAVEGSSLLQTVHFCDARNPLDMWILMATAVGPRSELESRKLNLC